MRDLHFDPSVTAASLVRLVAVIRIKQEDITCIYSRPNKALNPSQENRRTLTLFNRELCLSQHLDNRRANHRARLCLPPKHGLPIQNRCWVQKH